MGGGGFKKVFREKRGRKKNWVKSNPQDRRSSQPTSRNEAWKLSKKKKFLRKRERFAFWERKGST